MNTNKITASGRIGPCWQPETYLTMPKFGGHVIDPSRIDNPPAREEYTELWRRWCEGKKPHEIPPMIREPFHRETLELTRSTSSRNGDGEWN